ncbi:MAG: protein-glutamate O-methyltransferase CheR [Spirochaetaceae bacterium]|jgi:chemotaxis protein methyltransferase CheR|nr:protein-glutamate O-methyltransferase CheR [Spirochaetaceae bacterium]GMO20651.1 MAG: protein-glutamate O-methyltransferase CheR [Termitinemataceae bacterium]
MLDANFFTDADFEDYRNLLDKESGIHFTAANKPVLVQRLRARLLERGFSTAKDYFKILKSSREELKLFLDSITTNLTWFFRNQPHFDALENFVLPCLVKEKMVKPDRTMRVWSAGCSTGEEPYTIAMLMAEKLLPPWKWEIIASDLSLKCLMTAKEGFYDKARIAGVPQEYLKKYFDETAGGYKIKEFIKSHIKFDYHNLKNISPWRNFDIIFCRNVLIYFEESVQRDVVQQFYETMNDKSFLYIGHSESLFGMKTRFEFVKTEWTTFYKKWPRQ